MNKVCLCILVYSIYFTLFKIQVSSNKLIVMLLIKQESVHIVGDFDDLCNLFQIVWLSPEKNLCHLMSDLESIEVAILVNVCNYAVAQRYFALVIYLELLIFL